MREEEIKIHDKDTFLEHRLEQESKIAKTMDSTNPVTSILTIELSTTELCNRTCVFCPRHDSEVYPNRNLHMSVEYAETISKNIDNWFSGKISISGFSENFLNKKLHDIIKVMKKNLPNSTFECNTNGDFLTEEYVQKLFINGLDLLYINLYDGLEQIEKFTKIMKNAKIDESKYSFRAHYSQEDYGLKINNRGGNITWLGFDESDIESLKGKPCYYPFYKMFIDWNGDVLFCSNDWGKEIIIGNLVKDKLHDVWFSDKMYEIRKKLSVGDRSHSPCNKCSVNGQLFGKKSFDLINEYYENSNNK
jgi:radical SAM protein with 4Fe4S-binding SPASM domain